MKIISSLIILSLNLTSFSQTDSQEKIKSKNQIGLIYTYEKGINKPEEGSLAGSCIGINRTIRIKNKFRFDVGLQFTKNVAKMEFTGFNIDSDPQNSQGYNYIFSYHNLFLDIPIKFNYFLSQKKKLNIYLIGGIYPTFFRKSNVTAKGYNNTGDLVLDHTQVNEPEKMIDATLMSTFGGGIEYLLNSKISVNIQSEFRYHFTNYDINYYDISKRITGNIGVRYNF